MNSSYGTFGFLVPQYWSPLKGLRKVVLSVPDKLTYTVIIEMKRDRFEHDLAGLTPFWLVEWYFCMTGWFDVSVASKHTRAIISPLFFVPLKWDECRMPINYEKFGLLLKILKRKTQLRKTLSFHARACLQQFRPFNLPPATWGCNFNPRPA